MLGAAFFWLVGENRCWKNLVLWVSLYRFPLDRGTSKLKNVKIFKTSWISMVFSKRRICKIDIVFSLKLFTLYAHFFATIHDWISHVRHSKYAKILSLLFAIVEQRQTADYYYDVFNKHCLYLIVTGQSIELWQVHGKQPDTLLQNVPYG